MCQSTKDPRKRNKDYFTKNAAQTLRKITCIFIASARLAAVNQHTRAYATPLHERTHITLHNLTFKSVLNTL